MSIRKFRHPGEATLSESLRLDGRNLRAAIELSDACLRFRPITPPRGVHRFASIEEANTERRRWETPTKKP